MRGQGGKPYGAFSSFMAAFKELKPELANGEQQDAVEGGPLRLCQRPRRAQTCRVHAAALCAGSALRARPQAPAPLPGRRGVVHGA